MVISFFGHKDYYYDDAVKAAAYSFVRKVAKGQVSFFVGCYGGFDKMSYDLAVRFKKEVDSTAKIVFVTPGINCTFDQTIAVNVNCLSFACLFLFSTQVQKYLAWDLTRCPFREIATASPLAMPRNDIKCVARDRIKKVRKFCNKFPVNKLLLYSVRSTLSLRAKRGNLPEGIP